MNTNNDQFWGVSPWRTEELEGKKVEFDLTDEKKHVVGVGVFRVRERPGGEQNVEIVVTTRRSETEFADQIFTLPHVFLSRIQRHPEPAKADFICVAQA